MASTNGSQSSHTKPSTRMHSSPIISSGDTYPSTYSSPPFRGTSHRAAVSKETVNGHMTRHVITGTQPENQMRNTSLHYTSHLGGVGTSVIQNSMKERGLTSNMEVLTPDSSPPVSIKSSSEERKDRQDWNIRQKSLQDELHQVQEECRRLRIEAEQRVNRRTNDSIYDRSSSSMSLRGYPKDYAKGHLRPHPSGTMDRSLSTSNSSLTGFKLTRDSTFANGGNSTRSNFSSAYSSLMDSTGPSAVVELEKAKIKIRKLEKELSVVEDQLKEKTQLGEKHMEELTQLRSLLAQEKSSSAMHLHETQEKAANDLGRLKALHTEQSNELKTQLTNLKSEKSKLEDELSKYKSLLKGSKNEVKSLSDNVSKVLTQLDEEKHSHRLSMEKLQSQVKDGQDKMGDLKRELKSCQQELSRCLNEVELGNNGRDREIEELREQVLSSNKQIRQCKEQLLESNMIIRQQHNELDTLQQQWKESEEEGEKNTEKLNEELHQTKITNQKLVKKLNDAENEMNTLRSRFTSLQQSSLKVHEFEGEVIQLRHSLGEQQRLRGELERTMESMKREAEKHKMEKTDLRQRLEQSSRQLSEMQERSEEWRGNREQLQAKVIKLQNLIDEKEKAFKELKDNLMELEDTNKCRQSDNESSINELQRELNKRSEQVMDLDCALRKYQGETAAKILQMERTLAQRQADLKMRTQEVEDLTKKYHQAQKVGQELQQLLDKTKSPDMSVEHKLNVKDFEISQLKQKETTAQEQIKRLEETNRSLLEQINKMRRESKDEELARALMEVAIFKDQIKQLESQEKTKQEEIARYRAQVASLSAELAVERQMVDEAREQLAFARASQQQQQQQQVSTLSTINSYGFSSSSPIISLSTPVPLSSENSFGEISYRDLPTTKHQSTSNNKTAKPNIIHI